MLLLSAEALSLKPCFNNFMVITKSSFGNNFLLKDDRLLVKIKSISDVWVLVKHVSDFAMFVKRKRSHKSLRLFEPTTLTMMFS